MTYGATTVPGLEDKINDVDRRVTYLLEVVMNLVERVDNLEKQLAFFLTFEKDIDKIEERIRDMQTVLSDKIFDKLYE